MRSQPGPLCLYTQSLLDGADYRHGLLRDDFGDRVATINKQMPDAQFRMSIDANGDQRQLHGLVSIADSINLQNSASLQGCL